jgi:hypothetical protein
VKAARASQKSNHEECHLALQRTSVWADALSSALVEALILCEEAPLELELGSLTMQGL